MKKVFVLAVVVLAMAVSAVYAQFVPPLINYQGRLTDAEGKGLPGTKKLEFSIFDAAAGGNRIWGKQVFDNVHLINGIFNVILGSTDTEGRLITDAFSAKERYIGVTVEEKEILPRQQVLSSPFAVQAEKAANADVSGKVQGTNLTIDSANGNISSSKFKVSKPIPYQGVQCPRSGTFVSSGGTLLIFVSASGFSASAESKVKVNVMLDDNVVGTVTTYTNESFSHKSLSSDVIVLSGITPGNHSIKLLLTEGRSDHNDYSQVTVLELPF